MKIVYEVTVTRHWSDNAHKIAGFFPDSAMAKRHIESWPQFIRDNLALTNRNVEDDFAVVPPEHMQKEICKEFYAWQNEQGDALEKLKAVNDEHRIVSIGGDLETAARELSRSIEGMRKQVSWLNYKLTDDERRLKLAETVTPYAKSREADIQEAWQKLNTAWAAYEEKRTRL